MEYTAKIIQEQKVKGRFWQYKFLDIQTKEEDYFYHHSRIDYIPLLPGKLKLAFDEQSQHKFYQLFEQDLEEEEILAQFEEQTEQGNEKLESNPLIKKVKLTPDFLNKLHYTDKFKWKTIAKIYGTSVWTLQRIRKGRKRPKQKVGRKRKIEGRNLNLLLAHVKKYNTATQQSRAGYFNKRGIKLHRSTVSRTLKRVGRTRKRATKRYSEQDLAKIRKFLKEHGWIYSLPNCLAVDEFSVHPGETSRIAWSRKGCPAIVKQKGRKGLNHTLILCVRNIEKQAVVAHKLIKNVKSKERKTKGTNAVDFYNFFKNIELPANEKHYLLLDNSKIHKTTKELIKLGLSMEELARQKNITLVYLPEYSPEINPVELCFNTTRHFTENLPTDAEKELKEAVDKIIDMFNKKNLTKYFRRCREFFSLVKSEQEFCTG